MASTAVWSKTVVLLFLTFCVALIIYGALVFGEACIGRYQLSHIP